MQSPGPDFNRRVETACTLAQAHWLQCSVHYKSTVLSQLQTPIIQAHELLGLYHVKIANESICIYVSLFEHCLKIPSKEIEGEC